MRVRRAPPARGSRRKIPIRVTLSAPHSFSFVFSLTRFLLRPISNLHLAIVERSGGGQAHTHLLVLNATNNCEKISEHKKRKLVGLN
jgi:hypothetical protein